MREIKFRAFDEETDTMYQEIGVTTDGVAFQYNEIDEEVIYFPDAELMQYTGLKDKNGTEIYEGDIVDVHWQSYDKAHTGIDKGVVFYSNGAFTLYRAKEFTQGTLSYMGNLSFHLKETADNGELYSKVIGNIYENSDLKEKED